MADLDCQVSYAGQTSDQRPLSALIRCPFAGDSADVIYVYDRNNDMQATGEWQTSVDFDDDLWVFDAGADNQAELVIDFYRQGNSLVADLYDDQNQDGRVEYKTGVQGVRVAESKFPTLRFIAPDGWWQKDGKINYNLKIEVDGPTRATFFTFGQLFPNLAVDGQVDYAITIQDHNTDGRPDVELRQVLLPVPENAGIRTELIVNTGKNEIPPVQDYYFWPYLGNPPDYIKLYGEGYPPILVDWGDKRIKALTEFVATRSQEANWFIYSANPFGVDGDTYANFENPFGFYDLAEDHDGIPELIVRNQYSAAYDSLFMKGKYSQSIDLIRYTWDQDNDRGQDFKLDLIGRHPITTTVNLPGLQVQTIPYAEFPSWVIDKTWDTGVLVAVEDWNYWSSEGIYEGFIREWYDFYVTGLSSERYLDLEKVKDIPAGMRQEQAPELFDQAWLYRSTLDRRLHLRGAIQGVWRLDETNVIRYYDRSGDGYVDLWQHEREGKVIASLAWSPGLLLLVQGDEVQLKEVALPASDYTTLPPRDHASWQAIRQVLEDADDAEQPVSLEDMFERLPGEISSLAGAWVEQVQPSADGIKFILNLQEGYQPSGPAFGQLENLAPGAYLASGGASLQFKPYQGAQVQVNLSPPEPNPGIEELQQIALTTANQGGLDLYGLELLAQAIGSQQVITLTHQTLDLPAGSQRQDLLTWQPSAGEAWKLRAQLKSPQGELLSEAEVTGEAQAGRASLAGFSWPPAQFVLAGLALLAFGLLLGWAGWLTFRHTPE